jgi:hypothetical protein
MVSGLKYIIVCILIIFFLINIVSADGIIEDSDTTDIMIGNSLGLLSLGFVVIAAVVVIYIIIKLLGKGE